MKKIIAMLLIMVLSVAFVACAAEPAATTAATNGETNAPESGLTFTVTVIHKDQSEKTFTYTSNEEFVGTVLKAEGLIKGNDGPYGLEITEVDGEQAIYATDGAYWAVYVGEEYAMTGIDTTPITQNGQYKLVYTVG